MLEFLKRIPDAYKSWQASIAEEALLREEESLRESTFYLETMIGFDPRVPTLAKSLRGKSRVTAQSEKGLLFIAYAQIYIPEAAGMDYMRLRDIFGKGSLLLFQRTPLNALAKDHGISWQECLNLYRRGAQIASVTQLEQAKIELTT